MDESDVVDSTGYMLFYTRDSSAHDSKRAEVFAALQLEQAESAEAQPNGHKKSMVYISRPWAVLYTSCVDPGPMRNSDFACPHDGILPSRFHRDVVVAVCVGWRGAGGGGMEISTYSVLLAGTVWCVEAAARHLWRRSPHPQAAPLQRVHCRGGLRLLNTHIPSVCMPTPLMVASIAGVYHKDSEGAPGRAR